MSKLRVTLLSQGLIVHDPCPYLANQLSNKINSTLYEPVLEKNYNQWQVGNGRPYFYVDKQANCYYYHRSFLEQVKVCIKATQESGRMGGVEFVEADRAEGAEVTYKNYKFDLRVHDEESRFFFQNEVSDTALQPDNDQTIFEIQTGRGKQSVLTEPLLTPTGWKLMGDIVVGDEVIGRNGKPTKVTGVFPQPEGQEVFEVTTYDGRKHRVGKEHLWYCYYINTTENRRWAVRDTEEIMRLISMPNPRVYLPLPEPVCFDELTKPLPVDSYLMGVLIGDGYLGKANITSTHNFVDEDIINAVSECVGSDDKLVIKYEEDRGRLTIHYRRVKGLADKLEELSLIGKRSWEKTIPSEYLLASIEERWELLRGLMDTDGTVNRDGGQPSYSTTSKELAKQVQELAWSLGGIARLSQRQTYYTSNGEKKAGRVSYTIFLRFPKPSMLFKLRRKKELTRDNGQYNHILKVRIKSIKQVETEPMQCISVAAEDSLYVAKDYIVTHNTKTFQKVQVRFGRRTAIIVRPAYVKKWKYDCVDDEGGLYEPSPRVRVVSGVAGIDNLLEDGRNGELDRKNISTIIIPTTSLMLWLEEYSNRVHRNGIELQKFYEYLGVGLVGYDEIHEHFLTVYLSGVILNPPKLVEMSATLKPSAKKEFHRLRYAERFPQRNRVDVPYIRVCDIAFIYYSILVKKMRDRVNGMSMYNHKTFEQYLYQHEMIDDYFEMVYDLMKRAYFSNYQKGQKTLVFFSMIQTCTDFTEFLKKRVAVDRDEEFNIVRYVDKDKFEHLQAADIGVSSPEKAGTAIDLPGLVLALVTPAISDRQKNEQIAGRPRTVTQWEGVTPKVLFMHCLELNKHNTYLKERMDSLSHVAKSLNVVNGGYQITGKERVNYKLSPEVAGGKTPDKTKAKKALGKFRRKQAKQQWKDRRAKARYNRRSRGRR